MGYNGNEVRVLSPEEIMEKYLVALSSAPDTAELKRANAEVGNKYQYAKVEFTKANRLYSTVQKQYDATRDEITIQVSQEERKKTNKEDRLLAEEKKAVVNKRVNADPVTRRLDSIEYYVQAWATVIDNLKFMSGRIRDAIIEDTSERKMIGGGSYNPGQGIDKTQVWRSVPDPE